MFASAVLCYVFTSVAHQEGTGVQDLPSYLDLIINVVQDCRLIGIIRARNPITQGKAHLTLGNSALKISPRQPFIAWYSKGSLCLE